MIQISFPNDGSMIFDEAHYTKAVKATLDGLGVNPEHLPISKLISALGMGLIGNNWFGWRFPQVLMQIAALYLLFLIGKRFLGDQFALGAVALLSFDNIFFIHGGTLLIDMASFVFGFAAIELYLRKRFKFSAVVMGIALCSREMIIFYFIGLAVYHVVTNRRTFKPMLKIGLVYLLISSASFFLVLGVYDLKFKPAISSNVSYIINKNVVLNASNFPMTTITSTSTQTSQVVISNPIEHIQFLWNYHGPSGMTVQEDYRPYQYAWNWILPVEPFNMPTYFRVDVQVSVGAETKHFTPIWYQSQANPLLWYGFWLALGAIPMALKRKEDRPCILFFSVNMLVSYLPWVVLSIMVRRIGFNYYMIWTLPFVAIGIAYAWKAFLGEEKGKIMLALHVLAAFVFFLVFFPVRPYP
jgi:4-amino-4-deoxy-L-arabinose transferase-like glycosyltransferase